MATRLFLPALLIVAGAWRLAPEYVQESEWKAPSRAARKENPLPADEAVIAKGKAVYTAQCLSCHGETGVGDGVAAKDLEKHPGNLTDPKVQAQSDGALFWKITTGRAPMTAFGEVLSAEERWQVVHYVRTLGAPKLSISVPEVDAPPPARNALGALFSAYDATRSALAGGEYEAVVASLAGLDTAAAAVVEIGQSDQLGSSAPLWRESAESLTKTIGRLREAADLATARSAFGSVSSAAETAWARFGHAFETPLYVFECSKAFGAGKPGRWVQAKKAPANPYLAAGKDDGVRLMVGLAGIRPKDKE